MYVCFAGNKRERQEGEISLYIQHDWAFKYKSIKIVKNDFSESNFSQDITFQHRWRVQATFSFNFRAI